MALTVEDVRFLLDVEGPVLGQLLEEMHPLEREQLIGLINELRPPRPPWLPLDHQIPPSLAERWRGWLLFGGRGAGKRLALDTPLPTPTGWTTIGDVAAGDLLLDEQGRPCRVVAVSPVVWGDARRVRFSDGSELVADVEHQWLTWDHAARKSAGRRRARPDERFAVRPQCQPRRLPAVRTTADIAASLFAGREHNHSIPVTAPLVLRGVNLRIPPYVLGVWLGDGDRNSGRVTAGDQDLAEMTALLGSESETVTVARYGDRASTIRIAGLTRRLRRAGILGCKRVPAVYLRAAAGQRLAVLQGLMDTDGGWCGTQAEITVCSEGLADDVYELVVSLGMKATRSKRPAKLAGVEHGVAHRVTFSPTLPVFRLARKLSRQRFDTAQPSRRSHRYIVAVDLTPSVPMRCISVDSPSHLYLAGRAMIPTHNTAAITHAMDDHANGPPCFQHGKLPHRMGIIAPTLGDASASIVHGDDGLMVINPDVREVTRMGGTVVIWPNGSEAKLFGTYSDKDVDRLRAGGNRCFDIREEIAAWPKLKEGMAQADFGLRRGLARWVGATTPRPRPTIKKLVTMGSVVRLSTATTDDNPHLDTETRQALYDEYGGTSVGAQELEGKIIEEVSGALWNQELIEQYRVQPHQVPMLQRVRTYVDPSWGTSNDECGIIVAGLGVDKHVYILADLSKKTTPAEWGLLAALGYLPPKDAGGQYIIRDPAGAIIEPREWHGRRSERIIGEKNFQGEQVRLVMKLTARELGRRLLFNLVQASVGKRLRAEPVLWQYEKGRVHHVGDNRRFAGLEYQLTNWIPPEQGRDSGDPGDPPPEQADSAQPSGWSPDRLDALVFAVTDLSLSASGMRWNNRHSGPGRRTLTTGPAEIASPDAPSTALTTIGPQPPRRPTGIPNPTPQVARIPCQIGPPR